MYFCSQTFSHSMDQMAKMSHLHLWLSGFFRYLAWSESTYCEVEWVVTNPLFPRLFSWPSLCFSYSMFVQLVPLLIDVDSNLKFQRLYLSSIGSISHFLSYFKFAHGNISVEKISSIFSLISLPKWEKASCQTWFMLSHFIADGKL